MAYQNVSAINTYFTYGIEDHEGRKGTGKCTYGNELEALNGKTLEFYQNSDNCWIKYLTLEFEDQNDQHASYYFDSSRIRGNNLRTWNEPPPQPDGTRMFWKALGGTYTLLVGAAGVLLDASLFLFTAPVSVILVTDAWSSWLAYSQYNSIQWLDLKDDSTNPGIQRAYIKAPAVSNIVADAQLDTVFHWVLESSYTENHNLTIAATLTYYDYPYLIEKNVTTSLNIEIGPDTNNFFDTAYTIQQGYYGVNPMLWLGGNDIYDFYKIYLAKGLIIRIEMYVPFQADFDLFLYNPSRSIKASSTQRGDAKESITYMTDSTGWWYIEARHIAGAGFYNLSISVYLPGGCPFVYVWDGQRYTLDNNLMPTSLKNNGTDVEDYYKLEQTLIPTYQNRFFSYYSLKIREFENEHSYIDQIKLIAVDHNPDFKIAVTPNGEILNYWQPLPPISCIDNNGNNRLNEISLIDGNISNPSTYFNGQTGDYLTLNFGKINSENAKLILRDDKKCGDPEYCCIEVQILNNSEWRTVATIAPREFWSTEAVNLTQYIVSGRDLIVRLHWTLPHRLDYVGLDTSPSDQMEITSVSSIKAIHSTQGDVTAKLLFNDEIYAELTPNQQISLTFMLPNNPSTATRTFILYTNGHYYTITK